MQAQAVRETNGFRDKDRRVTTNSKPPAERDRARKAPSSGQACVGLLNDTIVLSMEDLRRDLGDVLAQMAQGLAVCVITKHRRERAALVPAVLYERLVARAKNPVRTAAFSLGDVECALDGLESIPTAEFRRTMSRHVERVSLSHTRLCISRHHDRVAVLMSSKGFNSLVASWEDLASRRRDEQAPGDEKLVDFGSVRRRNTKRLLAEPGDNDEIA